MHAGYRHARVLKTHDTECKMLCDKLWCLLFVLLCVLGVNGEYRCDDIHSTAVDRCEFVKSNCMEESMTLRLVVLYYCAPGGVFIQSMMKLCIIVFGILLLMTLFKSVGLTAEKYFSVMLSQISQDLGLPPRLAGVTFLALGNGAPDLSSSIAAIRSGNFNLAMGSLIGSVMFVGCVVAGRIVSLSNGIKSRAAQIRDILALCVAVVCVTIISSVLGRMTYTGVTVLLSLYASYVVLVAIADLTKKNYGVEWVGLLSLMSSEYSSSCDDMGNGLRKSFTERIKMALLPGTDGDNYGNQYEPLATGTGEDDENHHNNSSNTSSELEMTESPRKLGPVGERSTWGGSYDELHETTSHRAGHVQRSASEYKHTTHAPLEYRDLVSMSTAEYRARALAAMSDSKSFNKRSHQSHEELVTLEDMLETICEDDRESPSLLCDDIERDNDQSVASVVPNHGPTRSKEIHPVKQALSYVHTLISTMTNRMVIPMEYVLRATIPVAADTESFDRTWFTISCGMSPLWAMLYLSSFSPTWIHMLVAVSLGSIFSYLAWYTTRVGDDENESLLPCASSTNIPIGAALVAVYGFALAGMWIDTIAGELVGVIHTFGIIGHVKPSILGLTVLAWGNSLTDLMANISIALQSSGGSSMAMTACFAGPLFNLLLGLGIGFTFYLTEKDVSFAPLEFDIIVFIGCLFAITNCIGVISIALTHNQRLPKWSGWLMMGWYGVYMTLILTISAVS